MSPFEAAEIAFERAVNSDEVASARNLEEILGGNGEWTAERAYMVWVTEMDRLGFAEYTEEGISGTT